MPHDARAAVFLEYGKPLSIEPIVVPDPGPGQVLVKMLASGICQSQLHKIHATTAAGPMLMGHEATAEVIESGPGVTAFRRGDRVMIAVIPQLQRGEGAPKSTTVEWRGTTLMLKALYTWSTLMVVDQRHLVSVDQTAPADLTSIVGCAVLTGAGAVVNTARVAEGDSVAIFGVGGVGLAAVSAAANVGAYPIIAVDVDDQKLAQALVFGATHTVNSRSTDAVSAICELTGGGADFVFDAVGARSIHEQILRAVRPGVMGLCEGGSAVLVGLPHDNATIDMTDLIRNGKKLIGSWAGSGQPRRDLSRYIDWYKRGKLKLADLVTRRYSLDEINDGIADLAAGRILGRGVVVFES